MSPFYPAAEAALPILPPTYTVEADLAGPCIGETYTNGLTLSGLPRFQKCADYPVVDQHHAFHECAIATDLLLTFWSTTTPDWHHEPFWQFQLARGVFMPAPTWAEAAAKANTSTGYTQLATLPGERWAEAVGAALEGKDPALLAFVQGLIYQRFPSLRPKLPPVPSTPVATAANRLMYDSTVAADIPPGSDIVAGYIDGSDAWSDADFARFAGKTIVRICVFNNRFDAQMIDIEPGNNDASGAVPWVAGMWARSKTPTVYCFTDDGPVGYRISEVRAACDAVGARRPLFVVADWDNDPSTFDPAGDPEIVGKQYANPTMTGGHYDASIIAPHWPGVDEEDDMTDAELAAAIKRIYSGPDSLEEMVKADVRVMVEQDPETRAAIGDQAVAAVRKQMNKP